MENEKEKPVKDSKKDRETLKFYLTEGLPINNEVQIIIDRINKLNVVNISK